MFAAAAARAAWPTLSYEQKWAIAQSAARIPAAARAGITKGDA
jgi:hypothetical protein